jgi:hypothetical protein
MKEKRRKEKRKRNKSPWGRGFPWGWTCLAGCAAGHN